ncbi:hypothetical protein VP1G_00059 [Cytospora mali]|uniref:Uncharacterized protein n=1 Tax=Cytospora mali TaxID=578113 RepID=A0A194UM45_CYTMA|nr:hypothetical protein VP1G_00059 [Valsa mali var. pyri (nom. inval.)]
MKAIASLVLVPLAAASVAMKHGMPFGSAAAPFVSNSTGASCGLGYTYCGYILKEQKNFDDATILTAYCAAGKCDSTKGTTETDPMQALYLCLPQAAVPKKRDVIRDEPYTGPVKIEVLCACSGKAFGDGPNVCLNPDGDHIGRCSSPCKN